MKQIKQNDNAAVAAERKPEMAYKKPEIVAKSTTQHSYVAGCPVNKLTGNNFSQCKKCEIAGR